MSGLVRSQLSKVFWAVFMALIISSIPHVVLAETAEQMISTADIVDTMTREEALAKVQTYLDKPELQTELVKLGISPAEVSQRMAALSPAELNQLAKQMDASRYGGDIFGILILVLLIVLIIYLVKRI